MQKIIISILISSTITIGCYSQNLSPQLINELHLISGNRDIKDTLCISYALENDFYYLFNETITLVKNDDNKPLCERPFDVWFSQLRTDKPNHESLVKSKTALDSISNLQVFYLVGIILSICLLGWHHFVSKSKLVMKKI